MFWETPHQTLFDSIHLAKEKYLDEIKDKIVNLKLSDVTEIDTEKEYIYYDHYDKLNTNNFGENSNKNLYVSITNIL